MIDKPSDEWTVEDWRRLRLVAFELSEKVLEAVEAQGPGEVFSPQVAGYALIIAMGRLSGRTGYRHIALEDVWKLWTDESALKEFRYAFEFERAGEN